MKKINILLLMLLAVQPVFSQRNKDNDKDKPADKPVETPKPATSSINEKVKKCVKIEGLFTLYRDTTNGSLYMLVKKAQFGKQFIYFSYIENGVTVSGNNKGVFKDNKIFKINKYYNQVEFITQNTSFYFNPNSAISKASDANVNDATLSSEKIVASDESKGEYLIEADNLFLTEVLQQIKSPGTPGLPVFTLGSLSKSKTKYHKINNYPQNTDIQVKYVFENPQPTIGGGDMVADNRFVEVLLQHSLIEMPVNNFKPRYDDARVGYFLSESNDMTTAEAINYRDVIHRWNLEKKDKNAALSEPVKPITWWIEKTTPVEFRETIKNGVLQWNIAFEKAGFKNAVVVNIQPDTATWDAGDIRYNVLRWTSSPEPPFGGYGPSFVNPLTGEILGADIMFEWLFVTNRLKSKAVFDPASFNQNETEDAHKGCAAGDYLHTQNMIGLEMLMANNASEVEVDEFMKQALYYLVMHEVGHTMGLNHNMKASQLNSPAELMNASITESKGLIGSVMDYPAVNFPSVAGQKVQYYTTKPGPYDLWAIEFGYYEEADSIKSEARRAAILNRSTEPELIFGNDADDMRSPGKAIDPRVMIGDLSNDAITFATDRLKLSQSLLKGLKDRFNKPGASHQELLNSYLVITSEYATSAGVISRYIGGVYVDRSVNGQVTDKKPYTPVSLEDQKRAMKTLSTMIFAPDAMNIPEELLPYLQPQRRGYNFFAASEDPKFHDRLLSVQKSVLMHILHPVTLKRVVDSKLYGNKYDQTMLFTDLTNAIFQADMATPVNSFRQNLQIEYVEQLSVIAENKSGTYSNTAQAKAVTTLQGIQKSMKAALLTSTGETKDHRAYIVYFITELLDKK